MVYLKLAERFVLFRHHSAPPLDSALHLFSIVLSQRKPVVRLTYVVYTSALHLLYYHTWASWTNNIWINILILPRQNRNLPYHDHFIWRTLEWIICVPFDDQSLWGEEADQCDYVCSLTHLQSSAKVRLPNERIDVSIP